MEPFIPDSTTDDRMSGLERLLQRYLGPRQPEFGATEDQIRSIEMPEPLQRFFRFAGRWPSQTSRVNRFCNQDDLGAITETEFSPKLQYMDDRLAFVWENQGVWVAATDPTGVDPPVWIAEDYDHKTEPTWWKIGNPLSHFLVSFVLQELLFGSEFVAVAPGAMRKFEQAGLPIEPVWIKGEYAWNYGCLSYFFVGEQFLVRRSSDKADGKDWYACRNRKGAELLTSLGLPTSIR